jgi:hypothetical protein
VSATQNSPVLTAAPTSLNFSAGPGATPSPQTINVSAGGAATSWGITTSGGSWLSATPSTTMTPGTITVSANPTGLAQGNYAGTVTISAPGSTGSPVVIPVTFAVTSAALAVAPSSLTFFGATNYNPPSQSISITNAGTGNLAWTAGADSTWIGLSGTSGNAPASLAVSANASSLATGQYSGNVTLSSTGAGNSPVTVPVSLQVGTLLFSDNFNSGSASNWTISPLGFASGWSVVNGTYTYNGGGHTQSWAGSASWTDYTVAVDFQLSSLNDYPGGIRGRLNTTTGASYGVWIYPAERILKLFSIGQWNIDAANQLLAQSSQINIDTNWHNIRLTFKGSQIQIYYDNTLVIQVTDSTYTAGATALDVSNQPIAFDNVTVIGF